METAELGGGLAQKLAVGGRGVQAACPWTGGAVTWPLTAGGGRLQTGVPFHGIYLSTCCSPVPDKLFFQIMGPEAVRSRL